MPPDSLDSLKSDAKALVGSLLKAVNEKRLTPELKAQSIQVLKLMLSKWDSLEQEIPIAPITPIPKGADLLWILSGSNPQIFQRYMQEIPDAEMNAISNNPLEMQRIIQILSQQITTPIGEVLEGVPKASLQSSNIYGFKYNPKTKVMTVKFQGNKQYGQGPIYSYEGVPPFIAKAMAEGAVSAKTTGKNKWGAWWKYKNPSLGATHYALLRDRFPFTRVS